MVSFFSVRKSYALIGVIACVGWIFFFFRSEYFDLKGIEVQTSGGFISSADVLPLVFRTLDDQSPRPWSKRQKYFLPKQKIEEGIKTALYAEHVKVGETQNSILRLNISFGSRFLYTTEDGGTFLKCAVARPAGIVLDEPVLLSAAKKRYLSIDFTTQALDGLVYVRNATTTLEVPTIKALLDLGKALDEHQIRFSHLKELTGKDVSIQLDGNREVLIDLGQPLRDQIARCQAVLRDKDYLELKPSVIDLRIPGRAYLR